MKYEILMIDPPWPKKKGGIRASRPNQLRQLDYKTLSIQEIFDLLDREVFPQSAEKHTVFLWGVDQFLVAGEKEMLERGYRMHTRLIWDKTNGVAPAFSVRFTHEYMSWFYKPKFTPVHRDARGKLPTVFREKAREHSRKPEAVYDAVNFWFPQQQKLDVFSRQPRVGWSQFGDETSFFQEVIRESRGEAEKPSGALPGNARPAFLRGKDQEVAAGGAT